MNSFRFALHSSLAPTMPVWRESARAAEDLGYAALYITDHLDAQFGPLVALAVAAEATTTIHVGTLVLNNDLRNPVILAKEIAALGLAAEGRVEVGLGAGWLHSDYDEAGIDYREARVRVDRLAESLTILKSLWVDGEANFEGEHYTVLGAHCDPRPSAAPRLIVGGGSKRILSLAAERADTVGINTSLASGEKGGDVASQATFDHYDKCVGWIREAAGDRFASLELQIAAVAAMVVETRRAALRSATMLGFPGEEALDLPVLLIGTVDELCERLMERRERWGFSNVVVPDHALRAFAPVVARLAGT
ncbi:MAG TPA: TIGR03621 family F420-dependent LLM class oxidoreductase [Acidimicrobiales bacterium]